MINDFTWMGSEIKFYQAFCAVSGFEQGAKQGTLILVHYSYKCIAKKPFEAKYNMNRKINV